MENYYNKRLPGLFVGMLMVAVMMLAGGTRAEAQCFGSTDHWLRVIASSKTASSLGQMRPVDPDGPVTEATNESEHSIVGLWHVHYLGPAFPGGDMEAFQIFNTGGTEVHNPNTPTDGVCLGAWVRASHAFRLTHRVWLYDPTGTFIGVGHLEARISLGSMGETQTGTLTMQVFDLNGNPITPLIPGTLTGERVTSD